MMVAASKVAKLFADVERLQRAIAPKEETEIQLVFVDQDGNRTIAGGEPYVPSPDDVWIGFE